MQLYEADETSLTGNVARYLWEGLSRGEGALVIVTPEHEQLFTHCLLDLGADVESLIAARQLLFRIAQDTLAKFMVNGQPEWAHFERAIRAAMRQVGPAPAATGLRAYGEMVGVLWKVRQFSAAIRLEQLWNRLLEQSSFSLYCAYAIDIFGKEFEVGHLDGVLCAHSHLVPAQPDGRLETALNRAMEAILGDKARALDVLIKANYRPSWAVMPNAENTVLWLRKNLPQHADAIVSLARQRFQSVQGLPQ